MCVLLFVGEKEGRGVDWEDINTYLRLDNLNRFVGDDMKIYCYEKRVSCVAIVMRCWWWVWLQRCGAVVGVVAALWCCGGCGCGAVVLWWVWLRRCDAGGECGMFTCGAVVFLVGLIVVLWCLWCCS